MKFDVGGRLHLPFVSRDLISRESGSPLMKRCLTITDKPKRAVKADPDALTISASPQFARDGLRLARLALETGLPTACEWREMAEQGCLLSYNASITSAWPVLAEYIRPNV